MSYLTDFLRDICLTTQVKARVVTTCTYKSFNIWMTLKLLAWNNVACQLP